VYRRWFGGLNDYLSGFDPEFFVPVDLYDASVVYHNLNRAETNRLQNRYYVCGDFLMVIQF